MAVDYDINGNPISRGGRSGAPGGATDYDVNGRPVARRRTSALAAVGSGLADGFTMGWGDELGAGVDAGLKALGGEDYWRAYERNLAASHARQNDLRADHSGFYTAGQVGGSVLPFIGPGMLARTGVGLAGRGVTGVLAKKAASEAGRRFAMPGVNAAEKFASGGGGSVVRRILAGAGLGAGYGAVAGAGHADGYDLPSNAIEGGMWGGVFGGGLPAVSGVWNALRGGTSRGVIPAASSTVDDPVFMMSAGEPPAPGAGRPAGAPEAADITVNNAAMDRFLRLIDQNRMTLDDVEARVAGFVDRASPTYDPGRGRTFIDVLEEPAISVQKWLNKSPGQSASLADETFGARSRDALLRVERDLEDVLPNPPLLSARADVRQRFEDLSENAYRDLWATTRDLPPSNRETAARLLNHWSDDAFMQRGLQRGMDIYARRQRAMQQPFVIENKPIPGYLQEPFEADPLRTLHYVKRGLDEEVMWRRDPLNGNSMTQEEEATVRQMRGTIRRALDDLIPGYRGVNEKWGDASDAAYAMKIGQKVLAGKATPERIEQLRELTPFQREYFLTGLKHDVLDILSSRDVEGRRNIADVLLNTAKQKKLAEALGADAADAFRKVLSLESQLQRTGARASPTAGSDTGIFAAETVDDIAANMPKGPIEAGWMLGKKGLDEVFGGMMERRRDVLGRNLLQIIDDPDTAPQVREFLKKVRARAVERQNAAQSAASTGAQTGYATGAWTDAQDYF